MRRWVDVNLQKTALHLNDPQIKVTLTSLIFLLLFKQQSTSDQIYSAVLYITDIRSIKITKRTTPIYFCCVESLSRIFGQQL